MAPALTPVGKHSFNLLCIYTGHLGKNSMDLINYFEAISGVQSIPDDLNPATWMLEVTTPGNEERLGVDFATVFYQSNLCRCAQECCFCFC